MGCGPSSSLSGIDVDDTLGKLIVTDKSPDLFKHFHKMIILGDSGVGKTTYFRRLFDDTFESKRESTITLTQIQLLVKYEKPEGERGIEDMITPPDKFLDDGSTALLRIYDTPGHLDEDMKILFDKSMLRDSNIIILMFSLTNAKSFESIETWRMRLSAGSPDALYWVIGTKSDLKEDRDISGERAMEYCEKNRFVYSEVSSASGENIDDTLREILKISCAKKGIII